MAVRPGEVTPIPKETRPWVCKKGVESCTRTKPCRSCLGARNRRSGMKKQRQARKALEVVTGKHAVQFVTAGGNEENWRLPVICEVKSGKQTDAVWSKYAAAEAQANANKAQGDPRPTTVVFMGTRTSDGLFVCRLSELGRVMEALVEMA